MMFFPLLLILALLALAFGWWRPHREPPSTGPSNSALDILKERYARGEITKEEYERMRQDLQQ